MANPKLDALAFDFFREFARYEYCLKVTGLRSRASVAEASWDKYAAEVAHVFDNPPTSAFGEAVEYFTRYPPKKQIIKADVLAWEEESRSESGAKALRMLLRIRRVRNNLFHGGKFNDIWFAPERSELLLSHALVILHACRDGHDRVKEAYEGLSDTAK